MPPPNRNQKQGPKRKMPVLYWIFLGLAAIMIFNFLVPPERPDKIAYSEFKELVQKGAFQSVTLTDHLIEGRMKEEFKEKKESNTLEDKILRQAGLADTKSALRPQDDQSLLKLLDESKVKYEYKP